MLVSWKYPSWLMLSRVRSLLLCLFLGRMWLGRYVGTRMLKS